MSGKKTSSISFRINEEYEKVLRDIAEENKTSLNTLVNQIFGNYVEFELYAKKFGTLRMSTDTFRRILDGMNEKSIVEIATRCGSQEVKEFILFKWKELTSDSVSEFIKMYFEHCGYGMCDMQTNDSTSEVSIHHDFGKKGSIFLKAFLEAIVQSSLERDSDVTITDNSVTLKFSN